jgi:putative transposase
MILVNRQPEVLHRTYRYRLYPTARQRVAFQAQLSFGCELYNAALEQRRDTWLRRRRSISYVAQCRDLTDIRAHNLGPPGMSCFAMREPLRRLDRAFAAFFRRVKAGEKPGYPRFRTHRRYDSLTWDAWRLQQGRLGLPGIGFLKLRWHRPLPNDAELRTVTVRRHARHWYVGFSLQRPKPQPLPATGQKVGLDLGIKTFAALSSGELVTGPRALRAAQRRLRLGQRRVSRRVKGSQRRRRAGLLVARLHERVRNLRRYHAFKLATDLVRRFDVIYVEALNLQGLARSHVARDCHDQAWGAFLTILTDKAVEAGRSVIAVDARNTSQLCSACGALVPKPLGERWHRCACGYQADRDINAARNIYRLGESRQALTWSTGACVA